MSAYLCAADTFDYLASLAHKSSVLRECCGVNVSADGSMPDVPGLVSDGVLDFGTDRINGQNAEQVATILRAENIRSLQARYPSDYKEMLDDAPYTFHRVDHVDPVIALKSIACLRYQSCEADDYRETLAFALLNAIEHAAIDLLPGYNDAPWGWERQQVGA